MTTQIVCLFALLAASLGDGLELVSPQVLFDREPLRVRLDGSGPVAVSGTIITGAERRSFGPYQGEGGAEWALDDLPPGRSTVSLRVDSDRGVLEASWPVAVLRLPPTPAEALWPKLVGSLRAGRPARLLVVADELDRADSLTVDRLVTAGFERAFGAAPELRVAPTPRLDPYELPTQLPAWLAAYRADALLLLLPARLADELPADVLAEWLAGVVRAARADGQLETVVVTPPPEPRFPSIGRVLRLAERIREAAGRDAWIVDAAAAIWPAAAGPQSLEEGFAAAVGPDGEWLGPGHARLAQHLLDTLGGATARNDLHAAVERDVGEPLLRLELTGGATDQTALVWLFEPPLATPEGCAVQLPARTTVSLRRPLSAPLDGPVIGALATSEYHSHPFRLAPEDRGLTARFVPGRHVCDGDPSVPLEIRNGGGRGLHGVVRGAAGVPAPAFGVSARRTVRVAVPVALPDRGGGVTDLAVDVLGDATAGAAATVRYAHALVARRAPGEVDGVLDDWIGQRWYAVAREANRLGGPWDGPSDLDLRFALRWHGSGLDLALVRSDDQVGPRDGVELWWDARVEGLGSPGISQRLRLSANCEPSGSAASLAIVRSVAPGISELRLPWTLLGPPAEGRRLGLEVVARDDDPGEDPATLTWSGAAWGDLVPTRLPIMVLGEPLGSLPVALWVTPRSAE